MPFYRSATWVYILVYTLGIDPERKKKRGGGALGRSGVVLHDKTGMRKRRGSMTFIPTQA